jgi:TRAP-type C4-dicarboxylate transport system permease large subunit
MIETFKGVIPFLISDGVRVAIIVAIPSVTLILPHLLALE